jgi:hypothetical protein
MDMDSPASVLKENGVSERRAQSVAALYFFETLPRILLAMRLHGIEKTTSTIRSTPWRHADECNRLLEVIVKAPEVTANWRAAVAAAKPQAVRRINRNTYVFATFGRNVPTPPDQPSFWDPAIWRTLTAAELVWARGAIVNILRVGPDGEPSAGPGTWFGAWSLACGQVCAQGQGLARQGRARGTALR